MAEDNSSKLAIALPGEWLLQKVLGPTLDELGGDLRRLYAAGRDKIASAASKKIRNPEDGARANLRIARDVFWNGSFTEESICAEYFGGILASSRSENGKDDQAIFYLDIIKSLSSSQLHLHYVIYNSFNRLLVANPAKAKLNVAAGTEVQREQIWFIASELMSIGLKILTDLEVLFRQGLMLDYGIRDVRSLGNVEVQSVYITPTTLGIHLYAIAFNKFPDWLSFARQGFGDLESINTPKYAALSQGEMSIEIERSLEVGRVKPSGDY